jgi:hypothetical protein
MVRSHYSLRYAAHLRLPGSLSLLRPRRNCCKPFSLIRVRTISCTTGGYPHPRPCAHCLPTLSTVSLLVARHSPLANIFPTINTYKTASKQTTLCTFRMNVYAKPRGEVPLLLTRKWDSQSWLSPCTSLDYTQHAFRNWFAPEAPDSNFPNAAKRQSPRHP